MKYDYKKGRSKRQNCYARHFVIIRVNLITLPTDVFKSYNLSECCLYSFKHSKRYNRASTRDSTIVRTATYHTDTIQNTKTCHLPGEGHGTLLLLIFLDNVDALIKPEIFLKSTLDVDKCTDLSLMTYCIIKIVLIN